MNSRGFQLTLLAAAAVLVMALWFSATAIVPSLSAESGVSHWVRSAFTSAVQVGFVAGTLGSAVLGLADRYDPRRTMVTAATLGALANASILLVPLDSPWVIAARFLTGVMLAGVYPIGMKLAAGWARADMGLVVGLLVGAITVGCATPHLFNVLGGIDWRITIASASISALAGAGLVLGVRLGPGHAPAAPFDPRALADIWRNRGVRLAAFGYLGHMWELYAMWAWIGVFLSASLEAWQKTEGIEINTASWAGTLTFATIAVGAIGCVVGGAIADRVGRTNLTTAAMAISGLCCIVVGGLYGAHPAWLGLVCLLWGLSVVADSAQFSSCIVELSEPQRVGTMLTAQTCLGFTLTLVTIQLMPTLVDWLSWQWAFAPLALGPAAGCLAMWRLKQSPMAQSLAGGRG